MEANMVPKWLQNGSLEASGRPLGPTLLPDAPRSRPGEALARPGASQKIHLGGLGTPLERKVDRFRPPGGSPGGSRRVWEVIWGAFWRLGRRERKKQKSHQKVCFWELFLHAFSYRSRVCSVRLGARRRESRTYKYAENHWFLRYNLRVRRLRAEREHPSNRKKVEPRNVQMQAKNTMPRRLEKKPQKAPFWEPTCL